MMVSRPMPRGFFPARGAGGRRKESGMVIVMVIAVALMALGSLPTWHHSRRWGYVPSAAMGLAFLVLLTLVVVGVLPSNV